MSSQDFWYQASLDCVSTTPINGQIQRKRVPVGQPRKLQEDAHLDLLQRPEKPGVILYLDSGVPPNTAWIVRGRGAAILWPEEDAGGWIEESKLSAVMTSAN